MKQNKRPSLKNLKAFEAVARKRSYTEAGHELNVTHSAIIQQVRALENFFEISLIDRSDGVFNLTRAGQKLSDHLNRAFVNIDRAVEEVWKESDDRPLRVTMTPSFAAEWLMPKLQEFRSLHPHINLELDPTFKPLPLDRHPIDLAIRYGEGNWSDGISEPFLKTPRVVVSASTLVGLDSIKSETDLCAYPWLQELGTNELEDWVARRGGKISKKPDTVLLPGNMTLPTMRNGGGIAFTALLLVESDVKAGKVQVLFEDEDQNGQLGYYIVRPRGFQRPSCAKFSKWLYDVAATSKPS